MDHTSKAVSLPLRLVLAFSSPEYERRFIDHYVAFYLRYAQASLVLGLLLVFGDFLVDYFAYPEVRANVLRLQVCLPLLGTGLIYSFLPNARRHWQAVMAGFIVAMGACLFWILLRIDAQGGAGLKTWVGILNFTFLEFYCFVILGVQFRYALVSGLVILGAFVASMLAHAGLPMREIPYWSYHVVTAFILSAGIGWWREYLLRKEFAVRTSLDEARESAEHLARMKSEFLATMSHEIRTPMNGVLGMTELLLESGLSDAQRRHVHTIRGSGEALLTILNDILDFSKIEAGRVALDPIEVDIRDLGEDAAVLLALPAQMKGLDVHCRVAPDVPALVVADPVRIRQILLNLLGNAVKFTPSGEVTLTIERADAADGESAPSSCMLRFTVADSGIGISEEAQARLFQPFSQADGSTTRRYGGTGLGLAVSKQLAEMMGGAIGVDSEPRHGSRFWFTTLVKVPEISRTEAGADLTGVRVLIVDGIATHRAVLSQQISAMGAECAAVADGTAALEAMRRALVGDTRFDVVLIDATMTSMSSSELIYAVRADTKLCGTALVLLTTLAAAMESNTGSTVGANVILGKPVRRRDLGDALARLSGKGAPLTAAAVGAGAHAVDCHGARVLVAEDNPVNQLITRSMLEGAGCEVTLAADGRAALDLWRAQPFDLVLMDCQMPDIDGFEATRDIRLAEAGTTARVPIVALTANAMEGDRNRCLAAGMDDYLAKPFRRRDLMAVLHRWISTVPATHVPDTATEPG